jgi:hypothetical protein
MFNMAYLNSINPTYREASADTKATHSRDFDRMGARIPTRISVASSRSLFGKGQCERCESVICSEIYCSRDRCLWLQLATTHQQTTYDAFNMSFETSFPSSISCVWRLAYVRIAESSRFRKTPSSPLHLGNPVRRSNSKILPPFARRPPSSERSTAEEYGNRSTQALSGGRHTRIC